MYTLSTALHIKKLWLEHTWFGVLVVFILSSVLFTLWTAAPTFIDPDSFYHVKITELIMKRRGAVTDFPWLAFTTLADHFVDHHFLYHIALIPFFVLFGSLTGMKVATVLFAAGATSVFYTVLRVTHIRYSFLWTVLLMMSYGFSFRMALSKAPSIAIIVLFIGFLFLLRDQWKGLIGLSFAFVWTYGGFILLPVITVIHSIVRVITKRNEFKPALRNTIAVAFGTVAGLLIHPSFPEHLIVYWQQVVQIGIVNYQHVVSVGAEWYPLEPGAFISEYALLIGLFIAACIAFGKTAGQQTIRSKTALILALLFFMATLKSRRYIEYTLPWTVFFIASSLYDSGALDHLGTLFKRTWKLSVQHPFTKTTAILIIAFVAFTIPMRFFHTSQQLHSAHENGIPFTRYDDAGKWLRNHANKGDVIFHSDWDEFPILFYQAARGRYIVGLDPTFMYNKDPELYTTWVDITRGDQQTQLFEDITNNFNARFVFVGADNTAMYKNIVRDGRFVLAYEDDEVWIFRVPREQRQENSL